MSFPAKCLVILYLSFLALCFYRWTGLLPYHVDCSLYAYPDRAFNREALRNGLIPLWNPYIACGTPHLANWQSAFFYPPYWLLNLTELSAGYKALALAHVAWAFLGSFLWLRACGRGPLVSVLGAMAFAGSAHLTLCQANLPFIATASWIPWVFVAALRASQDPSFARWARLGTALGLQVLAGYPFFAFYTVIGLVLWTLLKNRAQGWNLGATLAATAWATSFQWLPFLGMLTYAKHDLWAKYPYFDPLIDDKTLLDPNALGLLGSRTYLGDFANGNFNLYFGILPLLLWLGSFLRKAWFRDRFWTLGALGWFLFMAGPHFPPLQWVPLDLLEFLEPSKAVGVFLFFALTSAAGSLEEWAGKTPPRFRPFLTGVLLLFFLFDLFRLPFDLLRPVPDPYQDPAIRSAAEALKAGVGPDRFVSLLPREEMEQTGPPAEALERSTRLKVARFLSNSNMVWGLRSADRYLYLQVRGSDNLSRYLNKGFPFRGDLLKVAGVRCLLLPQEIHSPGFRTLGKLSDDFFMVLQPVEPVVGTFGDGVTLGSRAAVVEKLAGSDSGWRERLFFEKKPDGIAHLDPPFRARAFPPVQGTLRETGARFSSRVTLLKPGYALFNETYAPGWKAWVDGTPVPILRADGLFMAMGLGAGEHQLDLRYEPVSFRLSLFLAFLFAGGFLLAWAKTRFFQ